MKIWLTTATLGCGLLVHVHTKKPRAEDWYDSTKYYVVNSISVCRSALAPLFIGTDLSFPIDGSKEIVEMEIYAKGGKERCHYTAIGRMKKHTKDVV